MNKKLNEIEFRIDKAEEEIKEYEKNNPEIVQAIREGEKKILEEEELKKNSLLNSLNKDLENDNDIKEELKDEFKEENNMEDNEVKENKKINKKNVKKKTKRVDKIDKNK